ncbi:Glycoside hydrolase, family GH5_42 [Tenacibaculum sp. 190524A02b]|uniref:glycosyl hydrolase n=1 Tax=Tenacibaculum vairaonense TaxID=3137860 RepID=UPI0032B2D4B1
MKKHQLIKQVLIILLFITVNLGFISLISKIYYEFNSGADRSKLLHINLKENTYYIPKTTIKATNTRGRKLNKENIKDIHNDYIKSWYVRKYALQNNNHKAIEDFYTDSAQVKIQKIITNNSRDSINIHSTSIQHNINIDFFSEDGQVVYLNDKAVQEKTFFYQNQKLYYQQETTKNYKAVLLLEDGFWRIRHIVSDSVYKTEQPKTQLKKINFKIKGINYYPQNTPWFDFWHKYDSLVVQKDLKIIKDLKLNTVRIFIPYEVFGKEKVAPQKLKHLITTLNIAHNLNLKVIITFFDFYSNYQVLDYTLCDRHVESIIKKIKKHPAILQYDIKNEPNLDFKIHSKHKVINWLSFIVERVRYYDPNTPITIGWGNADSAYLLNDKVDIISFHFYKKLKEFKTDYTKLKEKVYKPIVVQEFGKHSYNSIFNLFSHSEKKQANYHKKMQQYFKELNVEHFVSWTLYDFPHIDSAIFGRLPYKIGPQKNYGFINVKGKFKQATKYITNIPD